MWLISIIFSLVVFNYHTFAAVEFQNNGYNNLMVSIHPDVSANTEEAARQIINGIKNFIGDGSQTLYSATEGLAFIRSVNILLPTQWNYNVTEFTDEYFYEDGLIRVDNPNPLHQDSPYTLQLGGCGSMGEYMHLTPNYLTQINQESDTTFGPHDNIFVHEWAKLRYGVFEEYGYPGDEQYPLFYWDEKFVDGGISYDLTPNFCTDVPLKGYREDIVNGGACTFDPDTNLPDENCYYFPSDDNSGIRSSMMAAPFLKSVDHFCNDTEIVFAHDSYKPNKHNFMCNRRSTWDVISHSKDLYGIEPMKNETAPETIFHILQPNAVARYTLVLDRSGSMDDFDRLDRLQKSSVRWIKYELKTNSKLGVTSFSSEDSVSEDVSLRAVNDTSRDIFVNGINSLKAKGGTCLGDGLMRGMDTLNGENDEFKGGAIIFITDGKFECSGRPNIDNKKVTDRIKKTKVRIITVAFGKAADDKLENLAKISGGKTYFVDDGSGLQDINDVFTESNTYQPAVPSHDEEIVILQESYFKQKFIEDDFIIDLTLGRDVKFTLDILSASGNTRIEDFHIYDSSNNAELIVNSTDITAEKTLFFSWAKLSTHTFRFRVDFSKKVDYALVTVTSKAGSNQTLPYRTKCWASAEGDVDPKLGQKLYVNARVEQGNRPVLHAKVEANIAREDSNQQPITLDLFDNGSGSDLVANDGIYSRYFTKYDGNGRYSLKCQVKGDSDTGFIAEKEGTFSVHSFEIERMFEGSIRSYPAIPSPTSPACCGSSSGNNIKTNPTGNFTRKATGNSFKVVNIDGDEDLYAPERVTNLQVSLDEEEKDILVKFTATGEDLDSGTAKNYELKYTTDKDLIFNETAWSKLDIIQDKDILNGSLTPKEAGTMMELTINGTIFDFDYNETIYYMGLKAYDKSNQASELSNIATFTNAKESPPDEDDGLSGGAITGIVLGCLIVIALVIFGIFAAKRTALSAN